MELYNTYYEIASAKYENSTLFNILIDTLPSYLRAFKTKSFKGKKPIKRELALQNAKWLEFNKHTVNYMILDIDDNRFAKLSTLEFYIECMHLPKPTWILQTDRGYHIAYRISVPFPTIYKSKAYKKVLAIKEAYIQVLEADRHARNIKGVYRNPIMHEHIFNDVNYTLDELDIRDNYIKPTFIYCKPPVDTQISAESKKMARSMLRGTKVLLEQSMRNSTLFYYGMLIQKKGLDVEQELDKANDKHCYPILPHKEVERIAKSVDQYKNKNFVPLHDKNYSEWSKEDKAKYMREYRARKRSKDMATRSENMTQINKKKAQESKQKVYDTVNGLYAENYKSKTGNWKYKKIADYLGLSVNTVRKYIKEYENDKNTTRT
jgi:hypothetical protein